MWITDEEQISPNVTHIFAYEDDKIDDKVLVYIIDKANNEITLFPREEFFINKIKFKGFSHLPDELSETGYIKGGVQYYLNKKLSARKINSMTIEKGGINTFRSYNRGYKVIINYDSFKSFKENMNAIVNESKKDKSELADDFFYSIFPRKFTATTTSSQNKLNKVIRNIDESIIPLLSPDDITKIESFYEFLIDKKYKSLSSKFKLITRTKLKIDKIAIQELVDEFDKKLIDDPSENEWGKFLKKYLFLLDSKYVDSIPELNVVLAGARNVDFGLIDSYNYLDIFEIKKPSSILLSPNKDRGNYYWHQDTVKAITQAEKYLYNAERKGALLVEDIEREIGKTVKVVKPRAILLIGHSKQLDDSDKKTDFRILRNSLKNIEIVLYDELLERLKNQKNKVYE